jgi:serine/threonine-protein kinase HipA
VRELHVRLRLADDDLREVGTLVEDGPRVWFEFDRAYAASGAELSPLRLPLSRTGLVEHRVTPHAPIPGVFNDSRPEGWGLKLLHRAFQAKGRPASSVSPLEELAYLGHHTMGALVYEPATGPAGGGSRPAST